MSNLPETMVASMVDPIWGEVLVSATELALLNTAPLRRLDRIKQLGLGHVIFPGATHSRLHHSIGVMHLAGHLTQQLLGSLQLPQQQLNILTVLMRLCGLLHDIGHPPLSHAGECALAAVETLDLGSWQTHAGPAKHEDYTMLLLLRGPFAEGLRTLLAVYELVPEDIVAILLGEHRHVCKHLQTPQGSLLPLLHQLIASELDVDRLDYVQRDAYYCGLHYGRFARERLLNSICVVQDTAMLGEGGYRMGLEASAWPVFEHVMWARYNLFCHVYHHPQLLLLDRLIERQIRELHFQLPMEAVAYVQWDDSNLLRWLGHDDEHGLQQIAQSYGLLSNAHRLEKEHFSPPQWPSAKTALSPELLEIVATSSQFQSSSGRLWPWLEVPEGYHVHKGSVPLAEHCRVLPYQQLYHYLESSMQCSHWFCLQEKKEQMVSQAP